MRKLYRSQRDKKLFGLCGGLAEMLNVDSTLLRLVTVVTAFFSGGTVIAVYFIACLVIPKEPPVDSPLMSSWNHYASPASSYGGGTIKTEAAGQSNLDHMMQDIEAKAMWNEIQELKAKLAKYEKGE
jgi:phage shock protein C